MEIDSMRSLGEIMNASFQGLGLWTGVERKRHHRSPARLFPLVFCWPSACFGAFSHGPLTNPSTGCSDRDGLLVCGSASQEGKVIILSGRRTETIALLQRNVAAVIIRRPGSPSACKIILQRPLSDETMDKLVSSDCPSWPRQIRFEGLKIGFASYSVSRAEKRFDSLPFANPAFTPETYLNAGDFLSLAFGKLDIAALFDPYGGSLLRAFLRQRALNEQLDSGSNAARLTRTAMSKAAHRNQIVMLVFGASWCGPCQKLKRLLADHRLSAILQRHIQVVELTCYEHAPHEEVKGARALCEAICERDGGLPIYALLDPEGRLIGTSVRQMPNKISKVNEGGPFDKESAAWFLALVERATGVTENDGQLISHVLNDYAG